MKRRHRIVLAIILSEILFMIWYYKYLPMVDLPQQILTANVLIHYNDAETGYDQFFTKRFPWNPYSSYFWFAMTTEPLLGLLNSTRLYISLVLIFTMAAYSEWLREVAYERMAQVIPSTLLLLGLFFFVGLISYLFSAAFMFFSLALSSRLAKRGDRRTEALLALSLLVTYFSHVVTFLITLSVLGVQQLVIFRGRRMLPLIRAAVPSVVLFAVYFFVGLRDDVSGSDLSWDPFVKRLLYLLMPFNVFVDIIDDVWIYDPGTVAAWVSFLVIAGVAGRETRRPKPGPIILIGSLLVLSTLFFPSLIATSSAAPRLSYLAAFAVLALFPAAWDERRTLRWIVAAICILNPLVVMSRMPAFQREMAELESVIAALPSRQVIQPVITELHSTGFRTYPFLHSAAWYNIYKGGTNPYLFARIAHFPIRERRQFVTRPPGDWQMADFRYGDHQEGTDYFLVRTRRTDIIEDLMRHVPLAAQSGEWKAFGPNRK